MLIEELDRWLKHLILSLLWWNDVAIRVWSVTMGMHFQRLEASRSDNPARAIAFKRTKKRQEGVSLKKSLWDTTICWHPPISCCIVSQRIFADTLHKSIKAMMSLFFFHLNEVELSFHNFHCTLHIEIKSFWSSEYSVHLSRKTFQWPSEKKDSLVSKKWDVISVRSTVVQVSVGDCELKSGPGGSVFCQPFPSAAYLKESFWSGCTELSPLDPMLYRHSGGGSCVSKGVSRHRGCPLSRSAIIYSYSCIKGLSSVLLILHLCVFSLVQVFCVFVGLCWVIPHSQVFFFWLQS